MQNKNLVNISNKNTDGRSVHMCIIYSALELHNTLLQQHFYKGREGKERAVFLRKSSASSVSLLETFVNAQNIDRRTFKIWHLPV